MTQKLPKIKLDNWIKILIRIELEKNPYISIIAKKEDITMSCMIVNIKVLRNLDLIHPDDETQKGRKSYLYLTQKGRKIANLLMQIKSEMKIK